LTGFPQTIHKGIKPGWGDPGIFLSFHTLYYYGSFLKFFPEEALANGHKQVHCRGRETVIL
jgi:hypothetical protein